MRNLFVLFLCVSCLFGCGPRRPAKINGRFAGWVNGVHPEEATVYGSNILTGDIKETSFLFDYEKLMRETVNIQSETFSRHVRDIPS